MGSIASNRAKADALKWIALFRLGLPEVVLGTGKTAAQISEIAGALRAAGQTVLATRVAPDVTSGVTERLPEASYDADGRLLWLGPSEVPIVGKGSIAVVTAGTADLPVAYEAIGVARRFGNKVETAFDVGVAGLHRLLAVLPMLREARVVIAVAGMEGALPSVVGGLVDRPVIAVPTSVGYGVSQGGFAALLGMLASCASNVAELSTPSSARRIAVSTRDSTRASSRKRTSAFAGCTFTSTSSPDTLRYMNSHGRAPSGIVVR